MALKRLVIEDTSDCETCERRYREQWALLTEVKCGLLENIVCQECGREFRLFVPELTEVDQ